MSLPNTETKAERVERIKKEKNPLSVLDDVKRLLKEGQPLDDETVERLKWYGL
jgi:sulfite reductase (ferredoxin)